MAACIAFTMDSAEEAWRHMLADCIPVVNYGDEFEGVWLHTWDEGERVLFQCGRCGGFFLWQASEYHGREDNYFHDFFPVTGPEEAEALNRRWGGREIELAFPGRYLIQDDGYAPHWRTGIKEKEG